MTDPTIGQLVTFATIVAGFLYQFITQGRQRRWDLEDREKARARTDAITQGVAVKVDANAAALAKTADRLHSAIAENTDLSREAFREANSVNEKIQQIGLANKTVLDHLTNGKKKP